MSDEPYTPTDEDLKLAWALSRDSRDMTAYRYDLNAGMAAWEQIREEAFAAFDRWLADHDRKVKAEAWDEGAIWAAVELGAIRSADEAWLTAADNPYRAALTEGEN